jgi:hypothetical protein
LLFLYLVIRSLGEVGEMGEEEVVDGIEELAR